MSECPGWRHPCGLPPRYHIKWSWDGARDYPFEYDLCGHCAELCEEYLVKKEREFLTDTQYSWSPITAPPVAREY